MMVSQRAVNNRIEETWLHKPHYKLQLIELSIIGYHSWDRMPAGFECKQLFALSVNFRIEKEIDVAQTRFIHT